MRRRHFLFLLSLSLDGTLAFEKRFFRREPNRLPTLNLSQQDPTNPSRDEHDDADEANNRRTLLLGSTTMLTSALLGKPQKSHASNAVLLEESEKRRIQTFEQAAPSVVFIDTFSEKQDVFSPNSMEVPIGSGSGFVWDKEGHIVTNYHVVRNARSAQIAIITPSKKGGNSRMLQATQQASSQDEKINVFAPISEVKSTSRRSFSPDYQRSVYKAKVVGVDPGKDIAVLKVDAPTEELYPISVGTSTGLRVGQLALAIGNPFGLDHTLTAGIISGLGREVKSPIGRPITNVIQSDAAINRKYGRNAFASL